jgi:nucleotide-binding universal stress UspA family protein
MSDVARPVVAGIDGHAKDEPVLEFAAAEAARSGAALHLLYARGPNSAPVLEVLGTPSEGEVLDQAGDPFVVQAQGRVQAAHPDLAVEIHTPFATSVQALCQASETASLVVVGTDRRGPLRKAVLGTTTLATAMHAHCPVAVVPEDLIPRSHGPVMVAVDGSPDSASAVSFGLAAARARDTELVLLSVWHLEVVGGYVVTTPGTPAWEEVEGRHADLVRSVLDALPQDERANVLVRIEVAHGPYIATILERSHDAALLVLGSRGRGGIQGMLLGSVSHGVLHRAHCPVAVVRSR